MDTTANIDACGKHIPNLSIEEYHARPEWSHSQIEVFKDSPPLFHGRYITNIYPFQKSSAMDDGTIVHDILSSGRRIEDVVAIIPDDVLNGDGHRKGAAWKRWSDDHAGMIQRKQDECDSLLRMIESVQSNPKARWLLDAKGYYEHSIVWRDKVTGLMLRARPDKMSLLSDECVISDIKTTRAEDHRDFSSAIASFGYHRQAAWYWDGVESLGYDVPAFCFITVNKTPAHECHVYELQPSAIELGREENRQLLVELAHRLNTDNWTSRDHGTILEIDLPTWAYRQTQNWRMN
jgi:hypothetical protein